MLYLLYLLYWKGFLLVATLKHTSIIIMASIFDKVERGIEQIFGGERHSHTHGGAECSGHHPEEHNSNRYQSFAPQSSGHAKWYVDGCSYFWAVSEALERMPICLLAYP